MNRFWYTFIWMLVLRRRKSLWILPQRLLKVIKNQLFLWYLICLELRFRMNDNIIKIYFCINMKFDLKVHIRSHKDLLCLEISFFLNKSHKVHFLRFMKRFCVFGWLYNNFDVRSSVKILSLFETHLKPFNNGIFL